MSDLPFQIIEPAAKAVPFILSIPHCGTEFPDELALEYIPEMSAEPDDTDWFLDRLYDFASGLGITTIRPLYSRWVIDLNREPASKPLYDDGRIITALCPTSDFNGTPIYKDGRTEIENNEVNRRLALYFRPYHDKIDELSNDLIKNFGTAIFWDGHSIRRSVPTIRDKSFPDFILGDNDETTARPRFISAALRALGSKEYEVAHNTPFKGGYLTRSKGDPKNGLNALQLEMSKDLYMSNNETLYSEKKAAPIKAHLKDVFESLIEELKR